MLSGPRNGGGEVCEQIEGGSYKRGVVDCVGTARFASIWWKEEEEGKERRIGMFEWVEVLMDKVGGALPRWGTVTPKERAVLLRRGKVRKEIGAGMYFLLPVVDEVLVQPVVDQVVDLPDVTVRTKDGVSVVGSGVIEYDIVDLQKALFEVLDYDDAIKTLGSACLAKGITGLVWEGNGRAVREMEGKVVKELRRRGEQWGIRVKRVMVNRLIETVGVDLTLHGIGGGVGLGALEE